MTLNECLLGGNPIHIVVLFFYVTFVLILCFKNHVFLHEVSPKRVKSRSSEKVMKNGLLSGVISLKQNLSRLSEFDNEIFAQTSFTSKNGVF